MGATSSPGRGHRRRRTEAAGRQPQRGAPRNVDATRPGDLRRQYDLGGGIGGPLRRDRMWFFASARTPDLELPAGQLLQQAGQPDVLRGGLEPAGVRPGHSRKAGIHLTFQASKSTSSRSSGKRAKLCLPSRRLAGLKSPEAAGNRRYPWAHIPSRAAGPSRSRTGCCSKQGASGNRIVSRFANDGTPDDSPDDIAIFDASAITGTAPRAKRSARASPVDSRISRR